MAAEEIKTQTSISSSSEQSSSQKSSNETPQQPQMPTFCGFPASPVADIQMFPLMYPALVPGLYPLQQDPEQMNRGAGLYAVPIFPFMGPVAGIPTNNLIPLTYSIPTAPSPPEAGAVGEEGQGQGQGQRGEQQQQQQQQQQQAGPQRQVVVRRFQIAFQLDLLLILKLAAVIFLFNQDGSRQRLALLVFFALIVYLYQTGALAPLIRWLSQGMQRAAAPPQPPRPAVRAENAPAVAAEGQLGADNGNQPVNEGNPLLENEDVVEPGAVNGGNRWWGIVKEIQLIVFGFITSLLPGFHNID